MLAREKIRKKKGEKKSWPAKVRLPASKRIFHSWWALLKEKGLRVRFGWATWISRCC